MFCSFLFLAAFVTQILVVSGFTGIIPLPRTSVIIKSSAAATFNPVLLRQTAPRKQRVNSLRLLPGSVCPYLNEALISHIPLSLLLLASKQKSLTFAGLMHATALGIGLYTFLDFRGWLVCVGYLIFGSLVTKVKMVEKEKLGIAEKRGGKRGPENVWGSAATAMVCAVGTYVLPQYATLLRIGYVASLATKLSDTCGSEIGKAYGRTTYLITTLRRVPRGTEGAVSLEGTLAGVIGSVVLAGLAWALQVLPAAADEVQVAAPAVCVAAAFVATTIESYIGAVFQDNIPWLTNELVNLIMTVIGAAVAMYMYSVLPR
mmetsp:Transcript_20560/g.34947  ORF Transcript_20560/g.34947 Transcript_20560/m.34947 type:complete len:317 (+) Transcript_20560:54-1004(+)